MGEGKPGVSTPQHRVFSAFLGDTVTHGAAVEYDTAGLVDTFAEELAERHGIPLAAAIAVEAEFQQMKKRDTQEIVSASLVLIVPSLMKEDAHIKEAIWGLYFACSLLRNGSAIDPVLAQLVKKKIDFKTLWKKEREWEVKLRPFVFNEEALKQVRKLAGYLVQVMHNAKLAIVGLAFATEMDAIRDESVSMSRWAKRYGMHRATLSYWKRYWDHKLAGYGHVYGKSLETCERLREARMRVIARTHSTL